MGLYRPPCPACRARKSRVVLAPLNVFLMVFYTAIHWIGQGLVPAGPVHWKCPACERRFLYSAEKSKEDETITPEHEERE